MSAPRVLRRAGLVPLDFFGQPTDEPVVLAWMPAAAIYFHDPDGHLLEYIAMLGDPARPQAGVVTWREWSLRRASSNTAVIESVTSLAPQGNDTRGNIRQRRGYF
jgi:hypothetical protein